MKNNIGKIGIVGFGEIGQSLHKLYSDFTDQIFVKDLNRNDGLED
jgi:lactate dehydrogenase-like 2-hydroxyacid dehydrogenase